MDQEDFRALIQIVEQELRDVGLSEIADNAHYLIANSETGDVRLLEPETHLIEMLDAFDNAMAIRDHVTYEKAMANLNQVTEGEGPQSVVYIPASDEDDVNEIDFSNAPNLSEIREELRAFISRRNEPDPGSGMTP